MQFAFSAYGLSLSTPTLWAAPAADSKDRVQGLGLHTPHPGLTNQVRMQGPCQPPRKEVWSQLRFSADFTVRWAAQKQNSWPWLCVGIPWGLLNIRPRQMC